MAKQKKKRNKVYSGVDASISRPIITRVAAIDRNKVSQYWFDHKKLLKPVLITSGVVLLIIWMIFELVRIINN